MSLQQTTNFYIQCNLSQSSIKHHQENEENLKKIEELEAKFRKIEFEKEQLRQKCDNLEIENRDRMEGAEIMIEL